MFHEFEHTLTTAAKQAKTRTAGLRSFLTRSPGGYRKQRWYRLKPMPRKNPAAVSLGKLRAQKGPSMAETGKLGGMARARNLEEAQGALASEIASKGGKARSAKLTRDQRAAIARKAAAARWAKRQEKTD